MENGIKEEVFRVIRFVASPLRFFSLAIAALLAGDLAPLCGASRNDSISGRKVKEGTITSLSIASKSTILN